MKRETTEPKSKYKASRSYWKAYG